MAGRCTWHLWTWKCSGVRLKKTTPDRKLFHLTFLFPTPAAHKEPGKPGPTALCLLEANGPLGSSTSRWQLPGKPVFLGAQSVLLEPPPPPEEGGLLWWRRQRWGRVWWRRRLYFPPRDPLRSQQAADRGPTLHVFQQPLPRSQVSTERNTPRKHWSARPPFGASSAASLTSRRASPGGARTLPVTPACWSHQRPPRVALAAQGGRNCQDRGARPNWSAELGQAPRVQQAQTAPVPSSRMTAWGPGTSPWPGSAHTARGLRLRPGLAAQRQHSWPMEPVTHVVLTWKSRRFQPSDCDWHYRPGGAVEKVTGFLSYLGSSESCMNECGACYKAGVPNLQDPMPDVPDDLMWQ